MKTIIETHFKVVSVIFKNPEYNYKTSVNPRQTNADIKNYFVGTFFNLGNAERDNMQKCIDIEIN